MTKIRLMREKQIVDVINICVHVVYLGYMLVYVHTYMWVPMHMCGGANDGQRSTSAVFINGLPSYLIYIR